MNYNLIQPPVFTDTLDFENVNIPFITLDKNQYFLTKITENIYNSVSELRVFTDKDEINLVSNGIMNYFTLKLKSSIVEMLGGAVVLGASYTKDDTLEENISTTSPLNMGEIVIEMDKHNFLKKEKIYTLLLDKNDLLLSNMVSFAEMEEVCIKKEVVPVELVTPECVMGAKGDMELTDRNTMELEFIHRTLELDQLNIINDNIATVTSESFTSYDVEFIEGYIPIDDADAMSIEAAKEAGYIIDEPMRDKVYVADPLSERTPINKITAIGLGDKYININDKFAENIIIKRESPTIDNNFILSSDEARLFIDDYFKDITDPSINSYDEFVNYLKSLCDFSDLYLEYDFTIEGGKIYLGFNYNNMYSIFNSEAIKRILVENTGSYNGTDGITFEAARYFKNQKEIDKLAAYAQFLNKDFDISIDTVAQVFSQIKGIVGKLCIMSPDVIPPPDPWEIPVFKPSLIIIPPMFASYIIPYIRPYIQQPFYMPEYKIFIVTPPIFTYIPLMYTPPTLRTPFYYPDIIISIVTPPTLTLENFSYRSPTLEKGSPTGSPTYNTYSRTDGAEDRLVFFVADSECSEGSDFQDCCTERYKVVSTRTINMMEVGLTFNAVNISGFYWYDYEESVVMSAPMMTVSFLSDVMCRLSELTDYFFNVSIQMGTSSSSNIPDGEEGEESYCMLSWDSVNQPAQNIPEKIMRVFDSNYFELNGLKIDSSGVRTGTPILAATELVCSACMEGMACWTEYKSSAYAAVVESHAQAMAPQIEEYVRGRRLDKWLEIEQRPEQVQSLDALIAGDVELALAEYVKTKYEKNPALVLSSFADPLGIFASTLTVDISIRDLVYPYDNILIGTVDEQVIDDRLEYMKAPPPPKSGNNDVYIWAPNLTSDKQKISKIPYIPLSSETEGVISTFQPIMYLEDAGGGSYTYDIAGADWSSVTAGVMIIEVLKYIDGTTEEKEHHTLTFAGKTIILGETESTVEAEYRPYTRDICDPWESPYKIFGILGLDGNMIASPSIESMIVYRYFIGARTIQRINANVELKEGCSSDKEGESGIELDKKENISTLDNIDATTLAQPEGETPGAINLNLNIKLSKMIQVLDGSTGSLEELIETGNVKLCMTMGVVDGKSNEDGDVLAQHLSQAEIDAAGGEDKVYVGPNPLVKENMTMERKDINGSEASVYSLNLVDILTMNTVYVNNGELFVEYLEPMSGQTNTASITLIPDSESDNRGCSLGMITATDFSSSGMTYYYKHFGQDATKPVVVGYPGSSEVDFINGNKLVATVPSPIPNVVATGMDNAETYISMLDLEGQNYVHFFVNNETMQIVIGDRQAAFSENITVKVMCQDDN